jgi:hypothetical protein
MADVAAARSLMAYLCAFGPTNGWGKIQAGWGLEPYHRKQQGWKINDT